MTTECGEISRGKFFPPLSIIICMYIKLLAVTALQYSGGEHVNIHVSHALMHAHEYKSLTKVSSVEDIPLVLEIEW